MHLPYHVVSSGGMWCGQCELIVKFNKQQLSDFLTENLPILNPYSPRKSENLRPHSSHSSRENATPSSDTPLLTSCKGVPPPRDSAIHWINYYAKDSALGFCNLLIIWIVIYQVESAIQLLNNRGWWIKVKNGSARNLLVNCWPEEFTNSFTNSSRTQPHMFSSSIPITPYVLSIPCSQALSGQKW